MSMITLLALHSSNHSFCILEVVAEGLTLLVVGEAVAEHTLRKHRNRATSARIYTHHKALISVATSRMVHDTVEVVVVVVVADVVVVVVVRVHSGGDCGLLLRTRYARTVSW